MRADIDPDLARTAFAAAAETVVPFLQIGSFHLAQIFS
jgi:hypothetical protein